MSAVVFVPGLVYLRPFTGGVLTARQGRIGRPCFAVQRAAEWIGDAGGWGAQSPTGRTGGVGTLGTKDSAVMVPGIPGVLRLGKVTRQLITTTQLLATS